MQLKRTDRPHEMHPHLAALLSVTLIINGCTVGPDYKEPVMSLPALWTKEGLPSKPPELAQWWKQLGDPMLDQLVADAVEGNLDVAAAKAKIREARAATKEDAGSLFPTLSAASAVDRLRNSSSSADASVSSQYQAGFDASWELDLFGGNKRALEAAKYAEDASQAQLRDTLVTLVGDVASYYVQARAYQELIDLGERSARSQRQTATLTRQQQQGGEASVVDVVKAEAQTAAIEADIPSYRIEYAKSVHRLGVLLGRAPLSLEAILARKGKIPLPPKAQSIGIPGDLLANRPDIRVAERQLAESTAGIGRAEANRYPSISLTGSIDSSATSFGDLGRNSTISWSLGPSINIPIFQGGRLRAAVDVAKAQRDQSFLEYQETVLSALEDVQNAIVSLNQSRLRRSKLTLSAAGYREAVKFSREIQNLGSGDLFAVLDAEKTLYSVEEDLIETKLDVARYYIALNKALGGGWDGVVDVSEPAVVDTNSQLRVVVAPRRRG
ncbi:efflux transporter outer membrane subunit [Agrobacterium tumefaciens]|uniref:efflux transporter outer membrane subunit n=2 Tax=Agrobacterium TaxID=357 RepID=UPI0012953368|nr:RND transporter [Agrobacterium sp. ICMP 6402]NTA61813.1 efflux transporter outer membrane subunit [Agrobacterium tumefaciens]